MTAGSELTRDQVAVWLGEYSGELGPTPELREFLLQKIASIGIEDPMIDTRYREGFGNETHVIDLVLQDLESYAT